jgi:hypothetical protein
MFTNHNLLTGILKIKATAALMCLQHYSVANFLSTRFKVKYGDFHFKVTLKHGYEKQTLKIVNVLF